MRRPPAGILIQGLGGVGKTTLARGFLQWLDSTGGLGEGCFWLGFQEIRSAEYVFNRLGEAFFGGQFATVPMDKKIEALAGAFNEHRFIIVWDNFESAAGIAGTAVTANLPDSDRKLLADFLDKLRGGKSKVIITSRSSEDWLGPQRRFLLPLGGLDREERWEYCEAILRDLGLTINRNDEKLVELMNLLGGHPLAMRAILPRLEKLSASQVAEALRSNLASLKMEGNEDLAKLYATLRFVEQSLPPELQPLLIPIAMHEGYVSANALQFIAQQVDATWTRTTIDTLIQALVSAGLLRHIGLDTYEMHPVLTGYLRSTVLAQTPQPMRDSWAKAFVGVMSTVAHELAPLELHEQRILFGLYGQNFHYALREAERLGMETETTALNHSLAMFAKNTRNFAVAIRLFVRQGNDARSSGDTKHEAYAYNQLGVIAQAQHDFGAAEQWYRKSLAISEKQGNEYGTANNYHQLGLIAQEQRDSAAEQWYRKSLATNEKQGNEDGAARTYHQLGRMALEDLDFVASEQWYRKALAINEKQRDEVGAASTYHQLGMLAQVQEDFVAANQWYLRSLAISEKLGVEYGAAKTYHQLGMVADAQRDLAAAEQWYLKAIALDEKQGDEQGAADTYHQLGGIALQQGDFAAAQQWYSKSLSIREKQRNQHGAAKSYAQLGQLEGARGNSLESGSWLIRSVRAFEHTNDPHSAGQARKNLMVIYNAAPPADQIKLKAMCQEAGLGEFPPKAA